MNLIVKLKLFICATLWENSDTHWENSDIVCP